MILADERRAIADGMAASRASTSAASRAATSEASRNSSRQAISAGRAQSSEAARRAVGRSLEEQRRGKTLPDDLNSLKPSPRKSNTLVVREKTGGRPASRGSGTWNPPTRVGADGGGIASPLTETAYTDRQYHPDQTLVSTDGILSFKVKPIKQIKQADANDNEVIQIFAAPVTTP